MPGSFLLIIQQKRSAGVQYISLAAALKVLGIIRMLSNFCYKIAINKIGLKPQVSRDMLTKKTG
jgi:hypothetical protein